MQATNPLLMIVRIPARIILFPIRLILSIFTGALNFILGSAIINKILYLISGIIFLGFLVLTWSAIFVQYDMPLAARIVIPCTALLAAYLTNPSSGIMKFLVWLVERIEIFNRFLKRV